MGNNFICCKRTENINNILKNKDELNNKKEEDYLNFDEKNNTALNNEIELVIETELPKDFPYNSSLNNENIFTNQNNNFHIDEQIIFSIHNIPKEEIIKIENFFKFCNKNGTPRSYADFNKNGWTKFYSENDPYFESIENQKENGIINIEHNKLKIYNPKDINKMRIYQGDLNIIGERNGFGKYITPYCVLIGMWKNDNFSGWGRESRCNGDTFEGRFENGLINGKGIFMNAKNCKYIGDFKNMKRWGKGKLATDKIIYEGEFYDNMIHGKGRIKFLKNSVEYIGNFNKNKIDGRGVIKFKNGDKYDVEIKIGEIIKIENDIFENSNGGNYDFLLTKRNGSYDNTSHINNNSLNGFTETKQLEDTDNVNDLILSTYRNYGFND